jgi:hypothetical protein
MFEIQTVENKCPLLPLFKTAIIGSLLILSTNYIYNEIEQHINKNFKYNLLIIYTIVLLLSFYKICNKNNMIIKFEIIINNNHCYYDIFYYSLFAIIGTILINKFIDDINSTLIKLFLIYSTSMYYLLILSKFNLLSTYKFIEQNIDIKKCV